MKLILSLMAGLISSVAVSNHLLAEEPPALTKPKHDRHRESGRLERERDHGPSRGPTQQDSKNSSAPIHRRHPGQIHNGSRIGELSHAGHMRPNDRPHSKSARLGEGQSEGLHRHLSNTDRGRDRDNRSGSARVHHPDHRFGEHRHSDHRHSDHHGPHNSPNHPSSSFAGHDRHGHSYGGHNHRPSASRDGHHARSHSERDGHFVGNHHGRKGHPSRDRVHARQGRGPGSHYAHDRNSDRGQRFAGHSAKSPDYHRSASEEHKHRMEHRDQGRVHDRAAPQDHHRRSVVKKG